jgi:hypothetical protein
VPASWRGPSPIKAGARAGQQYAMAPDGRWGAVGKTIIEQMRAHGLEAR